MTEAKNPMPRKWDMLKTEALRCFCLLRRSSRFPDYLCNSHPSRTAGNRKALEGPWQNNFAGGELPQTPDEVFEELPLVFGLGVLPFLP